MDNRVPYQKNRKGEVFALGLRFPNLEAAEKGVAAIIARREQAAQRILSARELRDGPTLPDPRSERERISDAQWSPKMARPKPVDDNPFRAVEDEEDLAPREAMRRKSEREWDEKKAVHLERTSPQRLAAIKEAEETLELLRYEAGATQAEVERAQNLVTQARVGDLAHYREMRATENEQRIARYGDEAAKAQAKIDQAQAEFAASQHRITKLRPQQQQQQQQQTQQPSNPANEFIRAGDKIVEWDGDKIVARHDPATCDATIIAQAQ